MKEPFGDYTLLHRIGTGGMAEVFLARRESPSPRLVVVKRILAHLSRNRTLVELFLNEERIVSRLDHPNIARVYDVGRVGVRDYIAMEYVPGADLARLRRRCGRSPAEALGFGAIARLTVDVCRALHHAHELADDAGQPLGIVHGDIHLHNIIVTYEGVAKIIDFGVAQATGDADDTQPRGTYAYMAPEQLQGLPFDRRSDVFAVGVVLWEMLTGRSLFKRPANYLTITAVVNDPAPSVADFVPVDGGRQLDLLLDQALAKAPSQRFESCAAFADALEQLAAARGWDAEPDSLRAAMQRAFARERDRVQGALAGRTVEDWLLALDDDADLGWLFAG